MYERSAKSIEQLGLLVKGYSGKYGFEIRMAALPARLAFCSS